MYCATINVDKATSYCTWKLHTSGIKGCATYYSQVGLLFFFGGGGRNFTVFVQNYRNGNF